MSLVEIDITGLTGTSPFNVYVCDSGFTSCFYVTSLTSPGTFIVPSPYDSLPSFGIKIIDDTTCQQTEVVTNPSP